MKQKHTYSLTRITKHMTTRNFGFGTRSLLRAGKLCAQQSTKSFSTRGTLADRWSVFAKWVKVQQNITRMEQLTSYHVIAYGQWLKTRIDIGEMRPSTAQLYISAVNSIMKTATQGDWRSISPTKECGIPRRKYLPEHSKAMSHSEHDRITSLVDVRTATLLNIARTMGTRFKESALLDAKATLQQANTNEFITITCGTKGGKQRHIPVTDSNIQALVSAVAIQTGRSLVPENMTYVEF